jgi:pimeloyl-ACP methyl ester carboxylesterase
MRNPFHGKPRIAPIAAICVVLLAAAADGAQINLSTNPRPPNRSANEPPKPKTIQGRVEDRQGKPLSGARVFLKDTKTNLTRTATTDGDGVYEFRNLPPEVTYDLTAEFKDAAEKKSVSGLINRTDNIVDFQLNIDGGNNAPKIEGPVFRTYDGFDLLASFDLPTGVPAPIPAVLLIHGYGEDRSVFQALKTQLLAQGWGVMALDLRGHGLSTMKEGAAVKALPAWRTSPHDFPQDVEPALDWLKSQPRVNSTKIAVVGFDVGANLALIASGRFREVRTVVSVKPNLAESLALAGSAQDFHPRSALVIGAAEDAAQLRKLIDPPLRFLEATRTEGAAKAFADSGTRDAVLAWIAETF